jgi:DNA polymerase I
VPKSTWLANARTYFGPVHRVQGSNEWSSYTGRPRSSGALSYFGICGIAASEKKEMRDLVNRGGPWTSDERKAILDYCWSDMAALQQLLPRMLPNIDVPRALLRGRYMAASSAMEHNGTPIDTEILESLLRNWAGIQDQLIADVDCDYGVYDGRTFKLNRFEDYLSKRGIAWPRLDSGQLDLADDTFRQMVKVHPIISPLRELRSALSDMRLSSLAVGKDGRNRTILSAFRSRTSRNQPSNSRFIFGPSTWLRGLIKPPPGYGLAT